MVSEVWKLFVGVVMMVPKKDVVQPVLSNDFFQPMGVFGKIFAFQSDSDTDPVAVFFFQGADTFYVFR